MSHVEDNRARDVYATPSAPGSTPQVDLRSFRAATRAAKVEQRITSFLNEERDSIEGAGGMVYQNRGSGQKKMEAGLRALICASQAHRDFHLAAVERALATWPRAPPGRSDVPFSVVAHVDALKARSRQLKQRQDHDQSSSSSGEQRRGNTYSNPKKKTPSRRPVQHVHSTRGYQGSPPKESFAQQQQKSFQSSASDYSSANGRRRVDPHYDVHGPVGYDPEYDDYVEDEDQYDDNVYKDERGERMGGGQQHVYGVGDNVDYAEDDDDIYAAQHKPSPRVHSFHGQKPGRQTRKINSSALRPPNVRDHAPSDYPGAAPAVQHFPQPSLAQSASEIENSYYDDGNEEEEEGDDDYNPFDPSPSPPMQRLPRRGSAPVLRRQQQNQSNGPPPTTGEESSHRFSAPHGVFGTSGPGGSSGTAAAGNPYATPWPPSPHYYYLPPYGHPYGHFPPMYDATSLHFPLTERLLRDTPSRLAGGYKPSYNAARFEPGSGRVNRHGDEDEQDGTDGGYGSEPDGYPRLRSKSFDEGHLRRNRVGGRYEDDQDGYEDDGSSTTNKYGNRKTRDQNSGHGMNSKYDARSKHGSNSRNGSASRYGASSKYGANYRNGTSSRYNDRYDDVDDDESGMMSDPGSMMTKSANKSLRSKMSKSGQRAMHQVKDFVQSENAGKLAGAMLEHGGVPGMPRNAKKFKKIHNTVKGITGREESPPGRSSQRRKMRASSVGRTGSMMKRRRNGRSGGRDAESDDETSMASSRYHGGRRSRGRKGGYGSDSDDEEPTAGKLMSQAVNLVAGGKKGRHVGAIGDMATGAIQLWNAQQGKKKNSDRDSHSRGFNDVGSESSYRGGGGRSTSRYHGRRGGADSTVTGGRPFFAGARKRNSNSSPRRGRRSSKSVAKRRDRGRVSDDSSEEDGGWMETAMNLIGGDGGGGKGGSNAIEALSTIGNVVGGLAGGGGGRGRGGGGDGKAELAEMALKTFGKMVTSKH